MRKTTFERIFERMGFEIHTHELFSRRLFLSRIYLDDNVVGVFVPTDKNFFVVIEGSGESEKESMYWLGRSFLKWNDSEHVVGTFVNGKNVPISFNIPFASSMKELEFKLKLQCII